MHWYQYLQTCAGVGTCGTGICRHVQGLERVVPVSADMCRGWNVWYRYLQTCAEIGTCGTGICRHVQGLERVVPVSADMCRGWNVRYRYLQTCAGVGTCGTGICRHVQGLGLEHAGCGGCRAWVGRVACPHVCACRQRVEGGLLLLQMRALWCVPVDAAAAAAWQGVLSVVVIAAAA